MLIINLELFDKIDFAFPFVEMPSIGELSFHKEGCHFCDELTVDLDLYRGKDIGGEAIRLVHQEIPHLSAKALQWILPFYLKYCLTAEGEYNQMETEFLIYSLRPHHEYRLETTQRLSLLTREQTSIIIIFLEWCLEQEYWKEYFIDDINQAIQFLRKILSK
jgi:hypothetical protein